jgi:hypothetical protein
MGLNWYCGLTSSRIAVIELPANLDGGGRLGKHQTEVNFR